MSAVIVSKSSIHGLGVFSQRRFSAGETVLTIDDRRIVDIQHPLRPEKDEYSHHCDYLADGVVVLMGYPERYINSSCDPNTYVKTVQGIRQVIALREIETGEEITYDYIINCHGGAVWDCRCGSPFCKKIVPSSFFELPIDLQLRYLPLLDDWFVREHLDKINLLLATVNTDSGHETLR